MFGGVKHSPPNRRTTGQRGQMHATQETTNKRAAKSPAGGSEEPAATVDKKQRGTPQSARANVGGEGKLLRQSKLGELLGGPRHSPTGGYTPTGPAGGPAGTARMNTAPTSAICSQRDSDDGSDSDGDNKAASPPGEPMDEGDNQVAEPETLGDDPRNQTPGEQVSYPREMAITSPTSAISSQRDSDDDSDSDGDNEVALVPGEPTDEGENQIAEPETFVVDPLTQTPGEQFSNLREMAKGMFMAMATLARVKKAQGRINGELRDSIDLVTSWGGRLRTAMSAIDPEVLTGPAAGDVKGPTKAETEKARAEEIASVLEAPASAEAVIGLLGEKWPAQAFKVTTQKRRSIVTSERDTRVLIEGAVEKTHPIYKGLTGQFPSMGRAEGTVGTCVIRSTDAFLVCGGEEVRTERRLIISNPALDPTEENSSRAAKCLAAVEHIAREIGEGEAEIDVLAPEKGAYLWRKAFEAVFIRRDTKVTFCTRKHHGPPPEKAKPQREQRHAEVIISGSTYADIARQLRANASPETTGVDIWSMEETRAGETRVRVMGGRDMASKLCQAIGPKLVGASARTRQKKVAVQASRLEEECTPAEVVEAIKRALGTGHTSAEVINLRPSRGRSLRATVVMDEEEANRLVATPRVRIGLITTSFRLKPPSLRCRRCWERAHQGPCKGPDRSKQCFSCGKEGHRSAECDPATAVPIKKKCFKCGTEGHIMAECRRAAATPAQ